jgi:3-hydroxyisobutyrate dehydrogenase-like beta-hydroxyacid dehydrogenase
MVGGSKESFKAVKSILDSYSKFSKYMGNSGSGQLTKMVNQICIGGLLQALAEGMSFSEKAGLNTNDVMEVITKGAAQSWYMENRWSTMLQDKYDHGFAVNWMRKDLDIVEDQAAKIGASIEATKLVNNFYKEIQNMDGGRWDASSLLKRIKDL